jgi:DNA-binding beta-propeller fold protein YncE
MLSAILILFAVSNYTVHPLPLPGGGEAGIGMDYIGYDASTNAVWVPAGNTAAVDIIDPATNHIRRITSFATKEVAVRDRKRVVGPSAVAFGGGTAFIGNRGDSSVCAFDVKTLAHGHCQVLASSPDGLAYVAATKELWVTTPRDNSIRILDAATLKEKAVLTFEGSPEGFAVDGKRGRFYTNLEDKDQTFGVDIASHKILTAWNSGCGKEGPRGLRVDESNGHLFVACTNKVEVLDAAHDGAVLSSVDTGAGVDDIDYVPSSHLVYVGAARDAKLTIARDDAAGHLAVVATVPTAPGARNAAVTKSGAVYLPHSAGSDLIVVTPAP